MGDIQPNSRASLWSPIFIIRVCCKSSGSKPTETGLKQQKNPETWPEFHQLAIRNLGAAVWRVYLHEIPGRIRSDNGPVLVPRAVRERGSIPLIRTLPSATANRTEGFHARVRSANPAQQRRTPSHWLRAQP